MYQICTKKLAIKLALKFETYYIELNIGVHSEKHLIEYVFESKQKLFFNVYQNVYSKYEKFFAYFCKNKIAMVR